ncbi:hypothetical protein JAAARDRAFT_135765, partial [Jaapia argillacea MUCL 33604]
KFLTIKPSLQAGLDNLGKWYRKTDNSDAYFICLDFEMLNPSIKMAYFVDKWDAKWVEAGKKSLESRFNKYLVAHSNAEVNTATSGEPLPSTARPTAGCYGSSWMRSAVQAHQAASLANQDPYQELKSYLEAPLEDLDDGEVVRWWGHHILTYPILSWMAQDYLAIPGSSVAAEQAFSSGGITGAARHNHLLPDVFEALQLLKSTYCNG